MRQHLTDPAAIEAEIACLRSVAIDVLRRHWRVIFGRTPPAGLSKDLLRRMIAWRLQEWAFGGLDRSSRPEPDRVCAFSMPVSNVRGGPLTLQDSP